MNHDIESTEKVRSLEIVTWLKKQFIAGAPGWYVVDDGGTGGCYRVDVGDLTFEFKHLPPLPMNAGRRAYSVLRQGKILHYGIIEISWETEELLLKALFERYDALAQELGIPEGS